MEDFQNELRTFGGLVLAGTANDPQKAAEGLKQLNSIIAENEGIVGFLLDPDTQKMVKTFVKLKPKKSKK